MPFFMEKTLNNHCEKCPLRDNPVITYQLSFATVLFIIDSPNIEDKTADNLLSPDSQRGQIFYESIKNLTIDYIIVPVVDCIPYNIRLTKPVYKHCAQNLPDMVVKVKPKLIVCLGEIAASALLEVRGIIKHLGLHDYKGIPAIVTLSPEYPLHLEKGLAAYNQSILPVIRYFQKFKPIVYEAVKDFSLQGLTALDIETTGLNPHTGNIKSVAVSNGKATEIIDYTGEKE